MRQNKQAKKQKEKKSSEQLARDWMLDHFRLRDNPIMKENPEIGEELIQVLQQNGGAFKRGELRDQVKGQGVVGRTDWIVTHVELKPGEQTPVNRKQQAINPCDSAQLTIQLKLCQEQDHICPMDKEWNLAQLSVAKRNMAAKRIIIDLRLLKAKRKKVNLYISRVEKTYRSYTAWG